MPLANQRYAAWPSNKVAGVGLHITSLPGRFGIGEIGAQARAFVDAIRRMQLGVWQFLPLGPTGFGDSPYQPLSTFAGNELLIDVADLVQSGLLQEEQLRPLAALPSARVDYRRLIPLKLELLTLAASRFAAAGDGQLKPEYDEFLQRCDDAWLHDYALFRVLKSDHGERPWPTWQAEYRCRDQAALRSFAAHSRDRLERIKVLQFLFHRQWRKLREHARDAGVRLFGDMPVYVALDSADAWANRELLDIDADGSPAFVAGVPPDYFSKDGQLWGNPLYDWDAHASTNFHWWTERIRSTLDIADIVRIDHFRGFESYWSVPADAATARAGAWVPGPGDAVFDALHESLGELPLVAEDLGEITTAVQALRTRHRIPGMTVLQFAIAEKDFDIRDIAGDCVCYTGTHDNDTTLGWFNNSPARIRKATLALTGGSRDSVAMDLVRAAFETHAKIVIAPMQDYLQLGSDARMNTPGTATGNWRWRVSAAKLTDELCDNVSAAVRGAGRGLLHD